MAFSRQYFRAAVWAAGCFVAVGGLFAAEDAPPSKQPDPPATLEQALDKKLAFDLTETPLADVVDWLRSELKISIHVDRQSLDEICIGGETPITFHVSGIPVRAALNLMLEPLHLTWLVRDDVLVITTIETVGQTLETKTYDVADLVVRHDGKDRLITDYDSLIEIVTRVVLPASWGRVGGPGSIAPYDVEEIYALVVSQTREGHERVAALLAALRAVRKQTVARKDKPARTAAEWAALSRSVRPLQTPEERAIFQALGNPISADFKETPLALVVEQLGKQLGVSTHVAIPRLDEAGIGTDTPITRSLHDVPARSVLDSILRIYDLTWLVRNDALYVTTVEGAKGAVEIGVYDVADLVYRHDASGKPVSEPDFDGLIELITSSIQPTTWDEVGGPGSITCFQADGIDVILVAQTQACHDEVAMLLTTFRQMREQAAARKGHPARTVAEWDELSRGMRPLQTPRERVIPRALEKPISVDFESVTIADVAVEIGKQLGVPILLDQCAMDYIGVGADAPVTFSLHEVPARSVLDDMLQKFDLTWAVGDDVLYITSFKKMETRLDIGVYDVADLVYRHDASGKPIAGPDFESLVDLLTATVQPTTWDGVGGPGAIAPLHVEGLDAIIVAQTREGHEEVAALLASLRNMREHPKDAKHAFTPACGTRDEVGSYVAAGGDRFFRHRRR